MTEEAVPYNAEKDELREIRCKECGELIGREVIVDHKVFLKIGGQYLYNAQGWHECLLDSKLKKISWTAGDVLMARVLRRKTKRR